MSPTRRNGYASTAPVGALVVDEDWLVRDSLVRVLTSPGLEIIEATTGRAALDSIEQHGEVPLIVSDLYLPEMDRLARLRGVHRQRPDPAVIMLTGVAEVSTAKEQFLGQIQMAVRMLEKKDVYTRGHSQRVSRYAVKTAVLLGFTGDVLDQIRLGGELHDIGKIGTRDFVLNKPGPLTESEFEEIKKHVTEGEDILEPLRREHPLVLQIVRNHHERMDGSGFPDGLKAEEIPLVARVVAVVDAFDAMTTNRAYRAPRPPADALAELIDHIGVQFDAAVVSAFRKAFPEVDKLPITV